MADNPASVQDVVDRWRPLVGDELVLAATLIDDAWALLKHRDPTVETRLDAVPPELDEHLVRMVLVGMVLRVLKNVDGLRQESVQDYSYTRDAAVASGLLEVTDADLDLLAPGDDEASNAFTIRPAHQVTAGSSTYVAGDWEWIS